jgi:EpsI family protein
MMKNASGTNPVKILQPLNNFPDQIGEWKQTHTRPADQKIIDVLGVADSIDYTYKDKKGNYVNLYVGFYESVGTTGTYHSPKNCIPGGGWGIAKTKTAQISPEKSPSDNRANLVNISEMIIRNRNQYQVVFYWYQNRGRIISSEYWEKIYLVLDALKMKRRDGSFVRLMAQASDGDITKAEEILIDFSEQVIPQLDNFLPGKKIN